MSIHKVHKTVNEKRTSLLHSHKTSKHKPARHFPAPKNGANILSEESRKKLSDVYKNATDSELMLIDFMLGKMDTPEQVVHFFLGAHIELHGDNGKSYDKWKKSFGKQGKNSLKPRSASSSHKSVDKQYSVAGPVLREALFGTRYEDINDQNTKYTWIQLESRPVGSPKEWIKSSKDFIEQIINLFLHLVAYFDYKWNQNNIGPYGKSTFTEKNPLKIDVSHLTPEKERENRALWKRTFLQKPGVVTPELTQRIGEINKRKARPAPPVI